MSFRVRGLSLVGLSIAGPRARDVLAAVTDIDVSNDAFKFMDFKRVQAGLIPAWIGRLTYSGDLGYELWVDPEYQTALYEHLMAAGQGFGIRLFGFRALMSLRLEKSFGTWYREYRPIYTPLEAGINHYLKLDHEFVGRAALEAEMTTGPARRLVTFVVRPGEGSDAADVIGDEPIWHDDKVVGWVTSGGYAHHSAASVALGYVPAELVSPSATGFEIEIIGIRRPARLQLEPLFDPKGSRMRG